VSRPAYTGITAPRLEDNIDYITTDDGKMITTENDSPIVTEEPNIKAYFGDQEAIGSLREAMLELV
jgi:hypothetical protein